MLFTLGHGQHVIVEPSPPANAARSLRKPAEVVPLGAVVDEGDETMAPGETNRARALRAKPAAPLGGPFAYYFAQAPDAPDLPDMAAKLDALAEAMVEADGDPDAQNSDIPPIFTYFGQFIDHDITANTDRDGAISIIEGAQLAPLPRSTVTSGLLNLRNGALELDSLYGDGPDQGPFSRKLARLMRHPTLKDKMRIGLPSKPDGNRPPLPADPAADLLRFGRLIGIDASDHVTPEDLQALDPALRASFVGADGKPIVQKAIIGDARNDENLIVAQLQCAWLRFHNRMVDRSHETGSGFHDGDRFEWARQRVRWHYQWLVVNAYLPTVCDPAILSRVKTANAPLYAAFFAAHGSGDARRMPLPLEFSVAGFRFGHSMVRGAYDHNRFFGRAEGGSTPFIDRAPFDLLFAFTGNGHPPMPSPQGVQETLPTNWIIEWDRFVAVDPAFPDRSARRIDTRLARPLSVLKNEAEGVFKHLAKRNLRRGHRLNLPSAQDCIAGINAMRPYGDSALFALDEATLSSGRTGDAVRAGGFEKRTPLWFYVLKEAEESAGGAHLGALGSTLVAETLIGLIANDPTSYWNQAGSDHGRWHPRDASGPGHPPVDSLAAMLSVAGLLG
ncbi:heme peroxidase family protein [Aureimonas sp. AU22]|uniref:peroxidase family protein n=1 Tax=Aureimonas sp. AU22 TaxID=1638162 RepID=UPI0007845A19|nr:heme peroxidase family protein [Aureimonas sp. AU22]